MSIHFLISIALVCASSFALAQTEGVMREGCYPALSAPPNISRPKLCSQIKVYSECVQDGLFCSWTEAELWRQEPDCARPDGSECFGVTYDTCHPDNALAKGCQKRTKLIFKLKSRADLRPSEYLVEKIQEPASGATFKLPPVPKRSTSTPQ